jgi:hypothetical protein
LSSKLILSRIAPHVILGHSVPLTRAVLPPIRGVYQRRLQEVQAARQQGLTLDETARLLILRAKFPAFLEPPTRMTGATRSAT